MSSHAQWQFPDGVEPARGTDGYDDFQESILQVMLVDRLNAAVAERGIGSSDDDMPPGGMRRLLDVMAGRLRWMQHDTLWLVRDMKIPFPGPDELRAELRRAWGIAVDELATDAAKERRAAALARQAVQEPTPPGVFKMLPMPPAPKPPGRPPVLEAERIGRMFVENVRELATAHLGFDPSVGKPLNVEIASTSDYFPFPSLTVGLDSDEFWVDLRLQPDWLAAIGTRPYATIDGRLVGRVREWEHGMPSRVDVVHIANDPAHFDRPTMLFVPVDVLSSLPFTGLRIDPDSRGLHEPFAVADEDLMKWRAEHPIPGIEW